VFTTATSALPTRLADRAAWTRAGGYMLAATAVVGLGLRRGTDSGWDLLNYHLYNPHALLTGAFRTDVAPASTQSYLNPLLDLPLGVAVRLLGVRPGVLWTGIVLQGLGYLALWQLCREYFAGRSARWLPVVALAVAATGAVARAVTFSNSGDWASAAAMCVALRLVLKVARNGAERPCHTLWFAGLWLGVALGLKLTVGPFVVATVIALLVLGVRGRQLLVAVGGVTAGFLVTAGWWMVLLWNSFGNPLFPYYNNIFRSASAPPVHPNDDRFGAGDVWSILAFPFRVLRGSAVYSEVQFRDWRVVAVLVLGCLVATVKWRRAERIGRRPLAVVVVMVVGTVIWLLQFGIYRYFAFGELLASIVIVHCLAVLCTREWVVVAVGGAMVTLGSLAVIAVDSDRNIPLTSPALRAAVAGDHPYIVVSMPPPTGYLSLSLPDGAHWAALSTFDAGPLRFEGELGRRMDRFIAEGTESGGMYVVLRKGESQVLAPFELWHVSDCEPLAVARRAAQVCRLEAP
jgi:hypothetical protein